MSGHSILNVDDYQPSLYARSRVLRQAGFEVLEASSGAQALQLLSETRPSLVLLDVNLPDMSGFQVCHRIRANPSLAFTTVLHISASSVQSRDQVQGLEGGADGYLVEPVDPGVLVSTVRAFLRVRQLEDALQKSNEDLMRFAYTVAHELSEPLRTISAQAQRLDRLEKEQAEPSANALESLGFIIQSSQKLRSFIDDLLHYSHATHQNRRDIREIDSDALLGQVLVSLLAVIQSQGARVTHDPLPVLIADVRIEEVFRNLIGNAVKYGRAGVSPEVHVSADLRESAWVFSVRDNGIGIEPRYREQVFHIFRRLHGPETPGHGIGLALAQKIVEANGGSIWVESETGVGSTFYFTVPVSQVQAANGS